MKMMYCTLIDLNTVLFILYTTYDIYDILYNTVVIDFSLY